MRPSRASLGVFLVGAALVLALSSCGGRDDDVGKPDEGTGAIAELETRDLEGEISISSPAIGFEEDIPEKYGLQGGNVSPPLTFTATIEGAEELLVIVDDPDAPGDTAFVHWMVAGIDPAAATIDEGEVPGGAVEGTNDFGEEGYGGPSPPPGERHRYVFRVIALDAPSGLEPGFSSGDFVAVVAEHSIATAEHAAFFGEQE